MAPEVVFTNLGAVGTFIGTDIYDEVVDFASSAHNHKNLKFIKIAANEMLDQFENVEADEIIVFTSGCLAFVLPEHVDKLFNDISKCGKLVTLATQESAGCDVSNLTGKLPSSWVGSLSYSHNYRRYAELNNISVIEIILPEPRKNDLERANTIHYFMLAETESSDNRPPASN